SKEGCRQQDDLLPPSQVNQRGAAGTLSIDQPFQSGVMLPVLLGMAVLTVLNVVIETLFFLPFIGKVIRFRPAGAKKHKDGDENCNGLLHIISLSSDRYGAGAHPTVNPDKSYF